MFFGERIKNKTNWKNIFFKNNTKSFSKNIKFCSCGNVLQFGPVSYGNVCVLRRNHCSWNNLSTDRYAFVVKWGVYTYELHLVVYRKCFKLNTPSLRKKTKKHGFLFLKCFRVCPRIKQKNKQNRKIDTKFAKCLRFFQIFYNMQSKL